MKKIITLRELSNIFYNVTGRDFFDEDVCNDILADGVGSVVYELGDQEVRVEFKYNKDELDCDNLLDLNITITYNENIAF